MTVASTAVDEQDEDVATATLGFTWDVDDSDSDWTYETHAKLAPRRRGRLARHVVARAARAGPAPRARCSACERTPRRARQRAGRRRRGDRRAAARAPHRHRQDARSPPPSRTPPRASWRGRSASTRTRTPRRSPRAGEKAFVEAIVVRDGDTGYDVAGARRRCPASIDVPDTLPLAPTRQFARPILGTVGEATAEIVEKSDGAVVGRGPRGAVRAAAAVRRAAARAARA